ncbi:MAG: hypothetical protein JNK89_09970, partial [Saprospiraceae bacterium]|nr:hypothetical protein [Saprospiraceae bacterium]
MENNTSDTAAPIVPKETNRSSAVPTPPSYSPDAMTWLQTLPNRLDRADLFALNDDDFAIKCIHSLMDGGQFSLAVQASHPATVWFNHFYFESKNREKVFGTKNLCIGYPMAVAQVGGYELSAPLFLWQVQLEPDSKHADEWLVQKNDSHLVLPNYPLFHLLDALNGSNYSTQARQAAAASVSEQIAFAEKLRAAMNWEEEGLPKSVQPCPLDENLRSAQTKGQLCWTAVAGIFPTLPRTTLTQAPVVPATAPASTEGQHSLTLLPLDPSQRLVLQEALKHALSVVEGASGTGKTY